MTEQSMFDGLMLQYYRNLRRCAIHITDITCFIFVLIASQLDCPTAKHAKLY